jgi:hypothetical protein
VGKAKLPRCVGCLIGQDLFLAQDLSYGVLGLICCIYNKQQIRKSSNLLYICIYVYLILMQLTLMASCCVQVLPSIREKHDEFMLRELVKRWANHKVMVRWLSRFFHYLDRYFIARRSLPPLNEVGLTCFRDQVCHD